MNGRILLVGAAFVGLLAVVLVLTFSPGYEAGRIDPGQTTPPLVSSHAELSRDPSPHEPSLTASRQASSDSLEQEAAPYAITGFVRYPDGRPAADVWVGDWTIDPVRTKPDGSFALDIPPSDVALHMLVALTPDLKWRGRAAAGFPPEPKPTVDITLRPSAWFEGQVVDQDGQGLAHVQIYLRAGGLAAYWSRLLDHVRVNGSASAPRLNLAGYITSTDEGGQFLMPLFEQDASSATAHAPSPYRKLDAQHSLVVGEWGARFHKVFRFERGATLRGHFAGSPKRLRGSDVTLKILHEEDGQNLMGQVVALKDTWEATGLPAAIVRAYAKLESKDERWVAEARGINLPRGGEQNDVLLSFTDPVTIEGSVVDETNEPLPGTRLLLGWKLQDQTLEKAQVAVGEDGTFEISGWGGGTYTLRANKAGYTWDGEPFEVSPLSRHRIVVRMKQMSGLRGVVLDTSGTPVESAQVFVGGKRTSTNSRGEFSFGKAGFPANVYARHGGRNGWDTSAVVEVEDITHPIGVVLKNSPILEGTLVDADGRPLRNQKVIADQARFSRVGTTDRHGCFKIKGLYAGTYQLMLADKTSLGEITVEYGVDLPRETWRVDKTTKPK